MPLLLFQHLGLGDHILCNAMVREIAKRTDELVLLVKSRNVSSINYMFSDLSNVTISSVADDAQARNVVSQWQRRGCHVMLNGMHSPDWKAEWAKRYDEAFYEMAGVPFELRWKNFHVPRGNEEEEKVYRSLAPTIPYAFVHDDASRGFQIPRGKLPRDMQIIRPQPGLTNIIFHYRKLISQADQIHCISSSFAHWIENENLGQNRYMHKYVRRRDRTWNTYRNFSVVENRWW